MRKWIARQEWGWRLGFLTAATGFVWMGVFQDGANAFSGALVGVLATLIVRFALSGWASV